MKMQLVLRERTRMRMYVTQTMYVIQTGTKFGCGDLKTGPHKKSTYLRSGSWYGKSPVVSPTFTAQSAGSAARMAQVLVILGVVL